MLGRKERLSLTATLSKDSYEKHKDDITYLIKRKHVFQNGEMFLLNVDLYLEYHNCIIAIESIIRIISDPDVVVKISLDELYHHECTIETFLITIRKAIDKAKEREQK